MTEEITALMAFSAGFISFLAPCILPLIPPYFAWLLGVSEKGLRDKKIRLWLLWHGFWLILGFSLIFVILGAGASRLGQVLAPQRRLIQKIGGLLIILFGFELVGFLKFVKARQAALFQRIFSKLNRKSGSFLIGLVFGFAWVACFSPILGSILVLSSFQTSLREGIRLLSFYSLGLAVPFLLTSYFLGVLMEKIKYIAKVSKWVNLSSGLVLVLMGFLLLSDSFYHVVMWFNKAY